MAAKKAAKKPVKKASKAKVVAKRAPSKAVEKKVTVKKNTGVIADAFSKSELFTEIADATGLNRKQVGSVFEELVSIIDRHIKKRGVGEFTLPSLLKMRVIRKPATKARKGINPFNGEETMFKAKPARNVVKIRPLKKLKDMAV